MHGVPRDWDLARVEPNMVGVGTGEARATGMTQGF
jgi:hypothetical protein